MKFFMKSLLLLTLTMIVACGESDEHQIIAQKTKTATSAITIAYGPIGKMGCGLESVNDEDSVSEYFSAAQSGEIVMAQAYLLKIHRDLRCMSAYDFVRHYKSIMDEIELNYTDEESSIYVSPLVFILAEHGGKHLDYRAQKWLASISEELRLRYENDNEIALGIGFYYVRGISLISMEGETFLSLVRSMRSTSWYRAECPFVQSIIIEKTDEDVAIACLNDPCPIIEDDVDEAILDDAELFKEYCNEQKNKIDSSKENPTQGSGDSSGGYGSNMEDDDSFKDALDCANSYNESGDSFTCLVQVSIAGQRTIRENITGGFQKFEVGIESHISAKGCSPNPIAQGVTAEEDPDDGRTQEEKEEDFKKEMSALEALKKLLKEAKDKLAEAEALKAAWEKAKLVYYYYPTAANYDKMLKAEWAYQAKTNSATTDEAEHKTTVIRPAIVLERQQAVENKKEQINEDYPNMSTPYEVADSATELYEKIKRGWKKSCDVADPSGCSQTCSIADQQSEGMARCLGMNAVDTRLTGESDQPTTSGLGNPEEMVRTPEQVEMDPHFSDLVSCMADAMGFNPDLYSPGDACGGQILCTSHENASIDENTFGCSCSSHDPNVENFLNYQASMDCRATILCDQEQTCSCGSFGADLSQGGGLPPDPEVMLRVYASPQESY